VCVVSVSLWVRASANLFGAFRLTVAVSFGGGAYLLFLLLLFSVVSSIVI